MKNLENQIKLLQSKNTDEWETPDWLYLDLDKEFHFDLDVAASAENHKHPTNYFTIEDNSLEHCQTECLHAATAFLFLARSDALQFALLWQETNLEKVLLHLDWETDCILGYSNPSRQR